MVKNIRPECSKYKEICRIHLIATLQKMAHISKLLMLLFYAPAEPFTLKPFAFCTEGTASISEDRGMSRHSHTLG